MNPTHSILSCPVWRAAQRRPNAIALRDPNNGVIPYGQLHAMAQHMKGVLHTLGLRPRQTVALVATPNVSVIILMLALWRLRCTVIPLSPKWPPAYSQNLLSQTKARHLFVRQGDLNQFEPPTGQWSVLNIDEIVRCEDINHAPSRGFAPQVFHSDELITWVATSGTLQGQAKIAALTFGNHFFNALGAIHRLRFHRSDSWLLSLPLNHVSGLSILFRAWVAGASVTLPGRIPVEEVLEFDEAITHISIVSTQWIRWMKRPALTSRLRRLRGVLMGGGPIPHECLSQAREEQIPLSLTYGMTETAGQVATSQPGNLCLRRMRYRSYRIDPDGRLFVKGAVLFKGYLSPQGLSLPLSEEGDFFTGDRGREDPEKGLIILGRWDRMFISGGENVQPELIEKHLTALPNIEQALVIPREDDVFGEVPVAVLKFSGSIPNDVDKMIKTTLARSLPPAWIPKAVYAWPETDSAMGIKPSVGVFIGWLREGKLSLLADRTQTKDETHE